MKEVKKKLQSKNERLNLLALAGVVCAKTASAQGHDKINSL
jgi:hypothetical protein